LLSYEYIQKTLLFKSFTGLTIKEFDDIYDKEITKRYEKHEIKRLSNRKDNRKRDVGAGRPFKLDVKRQTAYDFSVLSFVHNIYVRWLSL
jgi:hypothetical protein